MNSAGTGWGHLGDTALSASQRKIAGLGSVEEAGQVPAMPRGHYW